MEKELVELFEAVKKAADAAALHRASSGGPEVDRCLDGLNQLRRFPVTYDVLVSTQVTKRLRPLTKHPAGQIRTTVSDVLEIWKKIITSEANRKKSDSMDIKTSKKAETKEMKHIRVEEFHKTSSIKLQKVSRAELDLIKSEAIKVEKIPKEEKPTSNTKKPPHATNGPPKLTSLIKCNDALRDKIQELVLEALSKVASEVDEEIKDEVDACDPIQVAGAVESVMFEKMGRSNGSQKVKYRSIMFNLKDPKNPDLRRKVLIGQVKPERLINMIPEEMASDERQ